MAEPSVTPDDVEVIADPGQTLSRWRMPVFDDALTQPRTAEEIESIEAAAYQEGQARGYQDGYIKGGDDARQQGERLRALVSQIARPLAQLDDEVERALVDLATAIARRLIGDALKDDPERVLDLARAALSALPEDLRSVRLHLHPDDAVLVRAQLTPPPVGEFRIVDDPQLARGDCRVLSESSYLDARIDARLALIAETLSRSGQ